MTDIVKITPNALAPLGTSSGHLVAVLAYDGVSAFELGIAVEIFGLPGMGVDWYRVLVCAEQPGKLLVANGGVCIVASVGLEALTDAVTIIVPGWQDIEASPPKALTDESGIRARDPDRFDLLGRLRASGSRFTPATPRRRAS